MEIIRVPLAFCVPWDKNPRAISREDYSRLLSQIKRLGLYKPLVAYPEGDKYVILGGNMRLRALRDLNHEEAVLSVVHPKTEAEKLEFNLSDNDRAGEYDEQALAELTYQHREAIILTDYKIDLGPPLNLKTLLSRFAPDGDDPDDSTPALDDSPAVTLKGDIFTFDRHLLVCGDATDPVTLTAAGALGALPPGAARPTVLLTDPPYGIDVVHEEQVGGGGRLHFKGRSGRVGGDGWVDHNVYRPITGDGDTDAARRLYDLLKDKLPDMIFFGAQFFPFLPVSRGWIVWDKNNTGSFGQAELAWSSFDRPVRLYKHTWNGLQREGPRAEEMPRRSHPTQKPVGLIAKIITDFTREKAVVLDPFIGSGSTLIAADKTGRPCLGIEIDPKYCDLILRRYALYKGITEDALRASRRSFLPPAEEKQS